MGIWLSGEKRQMSTTVYIFVKLGFPEVCGRNWPKSEARRLKPAALMGANEDQSEPWASAHGPSGHLTSRHGDEGVSGDSAL